MLIAVCDDEYYYTYEWEYMDDEKIDEKYAKELFCKFPKLITFFIKFLNKMFGNSRVLLIQHKLAD